MAIQISGTTVIDNSRNVTNAGTGAFSGTVTAPTFSGAFPTVFQGINGAVYSGPATFTVGTDCPAQVTVVKMTVMGGGGNGGTAGPNSPGGGGGSAVACFRYYPVSNGQAYSITVGGAAGTSSIVLSGSTLISSTGGGSSPGSLAGTQAPTTQTGASWTSNSGKGTAGGVLALTSGNGSDSIFGNGGTAVAPPSTGNPGTGFGSGGGGGGYPSRVGGNGQPGIVIIEW